uniref:Uncharacterized protein n=1 Tax=virus sp. ctCsQ3 TaxID=2826794 RepID=A0A8S5R7A3_9VIRU|nr:MAG TPA: hypothetical protein [virus sp. ctCsQ3]
MQLFCYLRGVLFYIRNFDFDNFRNLVQILFKSYSKNWKNFLIKYNAKILIPPSYAILKSKNRLHRILIFAPDFVQICPEKLMKNFNRLKCII